MYLVGGQKYTWVVEIVLQIQFLYNWQQCKVKDWCVSCYLASSKQCWKYSRYSQVVHKILYMSNRYPANEGYTTIIHKYLTLFSMTL